MNHRNYTVYGSDDMIDMLLKMETPEAKEMHNKYMVDLINNINGLKSIIQP